MLTFALLVSCDRKEAVSLSTEEDPTTESRVLVEVGAFEHGDVSDRLSVYAALEAVVRAEVHAEMTGAIAALQHREGDAVAEGDVVVRLHDAELQLAVQTKRIQAEQAKAKVEQADLAQREGGQVVEQKKLLLEKAQSEYDRLRQLAEDEARDLISKEELETRRFDLAQARLDQANAELQEKKLALQHQEAGHAERFARVELETAEYKLSQSVLRSPIDGTISYLLSKRGELVATGAHVFTVVNLEKLEARLQIPQRELARVRVGQEVAIRCKVFPEKVFQGKVDVVNPVLDVNGTVPALVGLSDPEGFLKPGLFITGEIVLETRPNVVLVPKKAVSYLNNESVLFLVNDGIARRYFLRKGFSDRDRIEVLGLRDASGEELGSWEGGLVIVGHNNLKDGSQVEIYDPRS